MGIKRADFAGAWYPGGRRECEKTIGDFMNNSRVPEGGYLGVGGVVPHAGWHFSGQTAFSVFHAIKQKRSPELFFIFGRHLHESGPESIFFDEGFETPLGTLKVHIPACEKLCEAFRFRRENAQSYTRDNTAELQLPFIRYLFPGASAVALGVAPSPRAPAIGVRCAELAEELGLAACFIGSTDLTHYGPNYDFMPKGVGPGSVRWVKEENDRTFVEALLAGDPERVLTEAERSKNACCPGGAAAAVSAAGRAGGKKGFLVGYTTSYDIQPDRSFVGYTGVVY
jgi:AmmeMemoRadiSam system protein B